MTYQILNEEQYRRLYKSGVKDMDFVIDHIEWLIEDFDYTIEEAIEMVIEIDEMLR